RPEFLNRVDEIIIFQTLTLEQVEQIVDLQMREITERLAERGLTLDLQPEARHWLAQKGYDPQFGARPLRRTLQREVESPLSKKLLQGELAAGDHVVVRLAADAIEFAKEPRPEGEAPEGVPADLPADVLTA
ncbi:MAG: ATP-dependent Clp protease ATP-binding subunit, partial [Chloroflexi bacterium]|nr:ATP-dependent Clp protease ATP-binding subunit [Chloroflexota bacterium]